MAPLSPGVTKKSVRLSSPSPSLAKPIVLKENPMDRVHAFLTELPFLD